MKYQDRKLLVTGLVAAVGAIIVEHMLKPSLKKGFKV